MKKNKKISKKIKINTPKELTNIVLEKDLEILGQGFVSLDKKSENKKYLLWKSHDSFEYVLVMKVSREYIKQRELKHLDKIIFVEYLLNNRNTIDIFKIKE